MNDKARLEAYATQQRKFWNTNDEKEAKFARVDTVSQGDEARFQALAESTGTLLLKDVNLQPGSVLLEVGCGVGRMIQQMQRRAPFSRLYGVDISETMISYTRKNTAGDPRLSLHVNTGYDLGVIPSNTVDFAYSVDVFIHIYDAEIIFNYLREVHRCLKEKGHFCFNVRFLNLNTMFGNSPGGILAKLLYKTSLKRADGHIWKPGQPAEFNGNKYRDKDLRSAVRAAGFNVLSTFVRPEDTHLWCLAQKDRS